MSVSVKENILVRHIVRDRSTLRARQRGRESGKVWACRGQSVGVAWAWAKCVMSKGKKKAAKNSEVNTLVNNLANEVADIDDLSKRTFNKIL